MAVPSYTTDLSSQVINACDSNATPQVWTNLGTGADSTETDYFIQNTACISKPFNITAGGLYVTTSGHTITSGQCYWAWYYFGCPNALLAEASGGLQALIGASSTSYDMWDVLGNDTYTYGGWRCIPIDPNNVGYDDRVGAGATSFTIFGVYCRTSVGIGKGNPLGIDIIKYGRGEARIADGSEADGYATFSGFATTNDNIANRWGLIQAIDGGYLMQGLTVLGYSTAVDFRDSNKSMLIANTKKVQSDFNTIEIRQSGSRVDMTSISFLALGTTARGNWVTTDNADINLDSCTFTDMGTFGFLANSTILNTVFRRTDKITTGGATLTGCTIDNNRATTAVLASSPANAALVSGCTFTSDGTGHGLEITGTAANMTLTNCTWTGYTAASGGNEAVYVNIASESMTLTISGGTTPSVRTAGCSVTVETSSRTIKVAVTSVAGAVTGANVFLAAAAGGPFPSDAAIDSITRVTTTATVTHAAAHGMATNDQVNITGITDKIEDNGVHTIIYINTTQYSYSTTNSGSADYTGTKKGTFVFLKGLATAGTGSNEISMSRAIPSSQPVTGWARKSTSAPYYKEGAISGTVLSTGDTTFSPVLISDD